MNTESKPLGVLVRLLAVLGAALPLGGLVLHVWTIVLALRYSGVLGGAITFMMPVIGQVYWFWRIWSTTGTLRDPYLMTVLAYVVCLIGIPLVMATLAQDDDEVDAVDGQVGPGDTGAPPTPGPNNRP